MIFSNVIFFLKIQAIKSQIADELNRFGVQKGGAESYFECLPGGDEKGLWSQKWLRKLNQPAAPPELLGESYP